MINLLIIAVYFVIRKYYRDLYVFAVLPLALLFPFMFVMIYINKMQAANEIGSVILLISIILLVELILRSYQNE